MDINEFRSIHTVLAFVTFVAIVIWAYSGGRKQRFEEAARLPFEDEELPASDAAQSRGKSS